MNDANLPQAVYYVMLYALILVIKIVKVFLMIKRNPNDHSWVHVTFIALEHLTLRLRQSALKAAQVPLVADCFTGTYGE